MPMKKKTCKPVSVGKRCECRLASGRVEFAKGSKCHQGTKKRRAVKAGGRCKTVKGGACLCKSANGKGYTFAKKSRCKR
jgi:hypothetical protein